MEFCFKGLFLCLADQDLIFWEGTQPYVKNGPRPRYVLNPEDIRDWMTHLLIMYSQLGSKCWCTDFSTIYYKNITESSLDYL